MKEDTRTTQSCKRLKTKMAIVQNDRIWQPICDGLVFVVMITKTGPSYIGCQQLYYPTSSIRSCIMFYFNGMQLHLTLILLMILMPIWHTIIRILENTVDLTQTPQGIPSIWTYLSSLEWWIDSFARKSTWLWKVGQGQNVWWSFPFRFHISHI